MRVLALVGLATLMTVEAASAASSAAQPTSIPHDSGNPWLHTATGLSVPAEVSGLKRTDVRWFSAPEVDVAAIYANADQSEIVTLYLFRNTSADVPVWFDRARVAILLRRELFGEVTPTGIKSFTPRGQDRATGLMESYRTTGSFSATMLAVLPVKGHYAKVRASSASKDPAALESLVRQLVDGINWTSDRQHPLAAPVSDCAAVLSVGKPARPIKASKEDRMMAGILGGVLAQAPDEQKVEPAGPPPTFCREPGPAQLAWASTDPMPAASATPSQSATPARP